MTIIILGYQVIICTLERRAGWWIELIELPQACVGDRDLSAVLQPESNKLLMYSLLRISRIRWQGGFAIAHTTLMAQAHEDRIGPIPDTVCRSERSGEQEPVPGQGEFHATKMG